MQTFGTTYIGCIYYVDVQEHINESSTVWYKYNAMQYVDMHGVIHGISITHACMKLYLI